MRISPHMASEIRRIDLPGRRTHLDEMTSVFQYYGLLQSTARARLSLTTALYRHSNTYIQFAGKPYGQTQKARSKAVLDGDLGKSGSQSAGRDSFQKLVSEVALGNAGLVMGLEVSRLARNSADWHRLIELCSLACTLIFDEDGVYDSANFNYLGVVGF